MHKLKASLLALFIVALFQSHLSAATHDLHHIMIMDASEKSDILERINKKEKRKRRIMKVISGSVIVGAFPIVVVPVCGPPLILVLGIPWFKLKSSEVLVAANVLANGPDGNTKARLDWAQKKFHNFYKRIVHGSQLTWGEDEMVHIVNEIGDYVVLLDKLRLVYKNNKSIYRDSKELKSSALDRLNELVSNYPALPFPNNIEYVLNKIASERIRMKKNMESVNDTESIALSPLPKLYTVGDAIRYVEALLGA